MAIDENPSPPRDITFADVASLLGKGSVLGFPTWHLRVRTVAVNVGQRWLNFATAATTTENASTAPRVQHVRKDLALVEHSVDLLSPLTADSLAASLRLWRRELTGDDGGYPFQPQANLERQFSSDRNGGFPAWRADVYELVPNLPQPNVPTGPFLNASNGIVAEDVQGLAASFLGRSRDSGNATRNVYSIDIEDRRARLTSLTAQADRLEVAVEGTDHQPLFVIVAAQSFGSQVHRGSAPIVNGRASITFPFAVQKLDLWVSMDGGYPLDHYYESPHAASRGFEQALYNAPPAATLSASLDALMGGESEVIEFKPYIRMMQRGDKYDEILESASAFANAGGGDIYVGVSDYGEPVGVDPDIRKEYGSQCKGDGSCEQESYVRDIRKFLAAGLNPIVRPEFTWHEVANRRLLQMRVPASPTLVQLVVSGDVFRRVSATNRKIRLAEALAESSATTSWSPTASG